MSKSKYLPIVLFVVLFAGCNEEKVSLLRMRTPGSPAEAKFLQHRTACGEGLPAEIEIALDANTRMEFILIPAGDFHMGSPKSELNREADEGPQHDVKISKPFYMGKYEVTQLQCRVIGGMRKKCKFKGDSLPVENIEWYDSNSFLNILSNKYGLKFRLPTEAEWEYCCRAGTNTPFYTGATISAEQANYNCQYVYGDGATGHYMNQTVIVGSYPPNAFGLYDMHGNVWEWCGDWYSNTYYKKRVMTDPQGPVTGSRHVIRGGSWNDNPNKLRSADRNARRAGSDRRYLGFRAVLDISGSKRKIASLISKTRTESADTDFMEKNPVSITGKVEDFFVEEELEYDEVTQKGYISVKGKGLEARAWMLKKIGEVCSSKNILIQDGTSPEPGYFRVLDEKLQNGKYTIEFEAIR